MNQVANAVPPKLAIGVALAIARLLDHEVPGSSKRLLQQVLTRLPYAPVGRLGDGATRDDIGNATS
jgi:hypothetical protein